MNNQLMINFDKYDLIKIAGGSLIGLTVIYLGYI